MDRLYTVSALNSRIKQLLDSDPGLQGIEARGELSNYKVYPSGHHYFTLKDTESSIRCVMFRSSASKLRFTPANGMGVRARGDVSVYERDGAYQLYCTALSPDGKGDLQAAFEQLKAKLSNEGLFDAAHKKPLPKYPAKIAVITSPAGAAVRDIIRVLGLRWPSSKVLILPVRVQGDEAPAEIAGALQYANRHGLADLIITGRGGGSIEDLWAFNDERVARAIFASRIPVISAVGHEPDVTISDYVADLRAATPSNAAELAVPDESELRESLAGMDIRSREAIRRKTAALRSSFSDLSGRRVVNEPSVYIRTKRMELDSRQVLPAAQRYLSERREKFIRLAASLDALSPLKVLARGYSIAYSSDGNILKNAGQVGVGDSISLRLLDGGLSCRVEDIYDGGT